MCDLIFTHFSKAFVFIKKYIKKYSILIIFPVDFDNRLIVLQVFFGFVLSFGQIKFPNLHQKICRAVRGTPYHLDQNRFV